MERKSEYYYIWKYFRKNKNAMIGLVIIIILIFVAIFANIISPFDPYTQSLKDRFTPGFWEGNATNILGTDDFVKRSSFKNNFWIKDFINSWIFCSFYWCFNWFFFWNNFWLFWRNNR